MNAYETTEIRAIIVSYGHMYMSVKLSLRTSLCFSMRKRVLKTLTVITTETIFLLAISELINCRQYPGLGHIHYVRRCNVVFSHQKPTNYV